ncbi:MAG: hypothetical protein J6S63_00570 [Atopobiaceae bacterium]|nr:hypothetical protein [Atopobiaceae bacterium]
MAVAEAIALFCIGLFSGILATMCDVLFVGAASFVSHFSLWVLLNALVAIHVDSRIKAIWWAIPFNLGFIESYFITTVASYEGYSKSFIVPLALVAIISPLLTNGIWTAKREKNAYGQVLSLIIIAGTLVSSFMVNGSLSVFAIVVCLILAFVLFSMPVRRLSISRGTRKQTVGMEAVPEVGAVREAPGAPRPGPTKESKSGRSAGSKGSMRPTRRRRPEVPEMPEVLEQEPQPRRSSLRARRNARREDAPRDVRNRDRRQAPEQRQEPAIPHNGMSTLGTARVARRSTRSTSRRN